MAVTIKNFEEQEKMRIAGRATASVLDMIGEHVKPGVTTGELDLICYKYITRELKGIPAPLNYRGFPKSICTSVNHVVCHGIPGDKKLKTGDAVNIDISVIIDGWHGDTSRMFHVGKPSIRGERLAKITHECMKRGIEMVKPGIRLGDIGHTIQRTRYSRRASRARLPWFRRARWRSVPMVWSEATRSPTAAPFAPVRR